MTSPVTIPDPQIAAARQFLSALSIEPAAAQAYVHSRLATALERLTARPTCPVSHALARAALANHRAYQQLTGDTP